MPIKHLGANTRGGDMTESQDDKYLKHNDHIDLLADATQQKSFIDVGLSSGSTLVLGAEDFTENAVLHLRSDTSPSIDSDWTLEVPATQRRFGVFNDTGFSVFVKVVGSPGKGVTVIDGARADLHADGQDIEELKRDVYDIGFFTASYVDGAIMGSFVAVRPFVLPEDLPSSQAYAYTAPDEMPTIRIERNESLIGTITFTAGSNSGSFSFSNPVSFVIGDRLRLVASDGSPSETAMASISVSLKGVA